MFVNISVSATVSHILFDVHYYDQTAKKLKPSDAKPPPPDSLAKDSSRKSSFGGSDGIEYATKPRRVSAFSKLHFDKAELRRENYVFAFVWFHVSFPEESSHSNRNDDVNADAKHSDLEESDALTTLLSTRMYTIISNIC